MNKKMKQKKNKNCYKILVKMIYKTTKNKSINKILKLKIKD